MFDVLLGITGSHRRRADFPRPLPFLQGQQQPAAAHARRDPQRHAGQLGMQGAGNPRNWLIQKRETARQWLKALARTGKCGDSESASSMSENMYGNWQEPGKYECESVRADFQYYLQVTWFSCV